MNIPTISELYTDCLQDLESQLGVTGFLTKKTTKVFAAVYAAKQKLQYIMLAKIAKNIFVDTCDEVTLERFGRIKLNRGRRVATQGVYVATATGTIGGVISSGTTFADTNGKLFVVDTPVTLTTTSIQLTIRALEGGLDSALTVDQKITSTSPILNVDSEITINSITVSPLNAETVEEYRQEILLSFRLEPQGGAVVDYYIWGKEAVDVKNIFPYTDATAGSITIYHEGGISADVENIINTKKPITAWSVTVLPATNLALSISISGLNDNSAEELTKITLAMEAYCETIRPYVGGLTNPNAVNDTARVTEIYGIVAAAINDNNYFSSISMSIEGNVMAEYQFTNGEYPIFNGIA